MVKIGLEIHQRLATAHKLFCNCSTDGGEQIKGTLQRKLHPVPSELGNIDLAAQFEQLKGRTFTYDIYDGTVCEIDADEAPPFNMNEEALKVTLQVCKMLNAHVVDEIHPMRKIVLDGSAITSFQRTALVGLNGVLKTEYNREISIPTICLEEESCGVIGEIERAEIGRFRLDRVGIPLIEIATAATIKDGKEAREVAEQIGLMLRATGKAKRGIGTIRQDINISIEGGARVEIKGVQDLDLIESAVEKEIARQKGLIDLCQKIKEIEKRPLQIVDVTKLFEKTQCRFVREQIWRGKKVFAALFAGMAGLLGTEIYNGYRYGTELSGYARAIGAGGIIHSDEDMKKYGFMEEIREMEKILKKGTTDAWIMIVGDEDMCRKALKVIYDRAYLPFIPEETRHVLLDGKSEYMRPLPGAARMYPETDVPPIRIEREMYESIVVPDFISIKKKLRTLLNEELADKMLRSEKLQLFEELVAKGVDPVLIATTFENTMKNLKREGYNVAAISEDALRDLFLNYQRGLFVKAAVPEIIKALTKEPKATKANIVDIVKKLNIERISGLELKKLIRQIGAMNVEDVMVKYRLRVDAEEVKEEINKRTKDWKDSEKLE